MAQIIHSVSLEGRSKNADSTTTRCFSPGDDGTSGFPSPWRAAFPNNRPLGYWNVFQERCERISSDSGGVIDNETAKGVWLSILLEYENYERMGMWIPGEILEEHRQVARALGWY